MARSLTTRQLILAVRSLIDETNEAEIDDTLDILPSLNRGFDDAMDVLARKYPDALIQSKELSLADGPGGIFELPEDAFQERLEKVEARLNGYYSELTRIDYRDVSQYDLPNTTSGPYYYCIVASEFRVLPQPSGIDGLRIWYVPEQGPLVQEYGRIAIIGTESLPIVKSYVRLTDVEDADQVSEDETSLKSYVNLIDHRTGRIKATLQISSITNNKLVFKPVPTRSVVQGRTVVGQLPASAEIDDYLCPVDGTCIPPMRSPLNNFLSTYASAELKALKLDGDPQVVMAQLKKFEERIEKTWVRRESSTRVSKVSRNLSSSNLSKLWTRTPRS